MSVAAKVVELQTKRAVATKKAKVNKGIIAQVRKTFSKANWLAAVMGVMLGGSVPISCYVVAHFEVTKQFWLDPLSLLVLGGLIFSAKTVFQWGKQAFKDPQKAFGFVVLIEGVMVFSKIHWLSGLALGLLIGVNAIATASTLADGDHN